MNLIPFKIIPFQKVIRKETVIEVIFHEDGSVYSAAVVDSNLPMNLSVTKSFQHVQNTPWAQLSSGENLMRLDLHNWFNEAKKQISDENNFDKEGA